jgi:hypothetical protein
VAHHLLNNFSFYYFYETLQVKTKRFSMFPMPVGMFGTFVALWDALPIFSNSSWGESANIAFLQSHIQWVSPISLSVHSHGLPILALQMSILVTFWHSPRSEVARVGLRLLRNVPSNENYPNLKLLTKLFSRSCQSFLLIILLAKWVYLLVCL